MRGEIDERERERERVRKDEKGPARVRECRGKQKDKRAKVFEKL